MAPPARCLKLPSDEMRTLKFARSSDQAYYYPGHFLQIANNIMQFSNVCFTLNNYTEDEYQYILDLQIFKYLVVGREVGEQGTPHLQGYGTLKNRMLDNKLRRILERCHIERRKGTHLQASDYCKKENNFIEIGEPPKQGERTDLEEVAKKIKEGASVTDIASEHTTTYIKYGRGIKDAILQLQTPYDHCSVRGIWIYGPPGTGKSYAARHFDPDLYIKSQNKWWDGYNGQLTVLLDDLDIGVLGHYLKIWADKWSCTGETKGGTIHLRHRLFVVTSNYSPEHFWSEDPLMLDAIERRFKRVYKQHQCELIDFLILK